jgi:dGTPase
MEEAKQVVRRLFDAFAEDPSALPEEHRARVEELGRRAIADYIAGMTDRFALKELARLGLAGSADDAILGAALSPRAD